MIIIKSNLSKIGSILFLVILILISGCSKINADEVCQAYIENNEYWLSAYQECSGKLAHWEVTGIQEEELAWEARQWCYLLVTDGERPSNGGKRITDIRLLNLTNEDIREYDYGGWNYWIACDTRYR